MKKVHEFEIKSKIVLLAYLNYYQYYLNYTIITTDTKNFLKMGGWGKSLQWQPFKFLIKKKLKVKTKSVHPFITVNCSYFKGNK